MEKIKTKIVIERIKELDLNEVRQALESAEDPEEKELLLDIFNYHLNIRQQEIIKGPFVI